MASHACRVLCLHQVAFGGPRGRGERRAKGEGGEEKARWGRRPMMYGRSTFASLPPCGYPLPLSCATHARHHNCHACQGVLSLTPNMPKLFGRHPTRAKMQYSGTEKTKQTLLILCNIREFLKGPGVHFCPTSYSIRRYLHQ